MTTGISAPPQSALTQGPTGRERLGSHLAKLRPGRGDLIDAAFAAVVTAIALVGFRTTFFGVGWIIAGAAGPKYGPRRPYFWVRIGVIAAIFVAGQVWWTVALWEFTPPTDYPP